MNEAEIERQIALGVGLRATRSDERIAVRWGTNMRQARMLRPVVRYAILLDDNPRARKRLPVRRSG